MVPRGNYIENVQPRHRGGGGDGEMDENDPFAYQSLDNNQKKVVMYEYYRLLQQKVLPHTHDVKKSCMLTAFESVKKEWRKHENGLSKAQEKVLHDKLSNLIISRPKNRPVITGINKAIKKIMDDFYDELRCPYIPFDSNSNYADTIVIQNMVTATASLIAEGSSQESSEFNASIIGDGQNYEEYYAENNIENWFTDNT